MKPLRLPTAAEAASQRAAFTAATPFPHVVWSEVVADEREISDAFPGIEWAGWKRYDDDYQRGKVICSDIEAMPDPLAAVLHQLNAPSTLEMLEELTGIGPLLPDPYLEGGGLHGSGPGGILTAHTDFHIYARLGLYRRLNLIVYLSDGWPDGDDQGGLGLFRPGDDSPQRIVAPTIGTCVVFQTDDRSPHGFASPVPEGRYRRSIAVYYYTAVEAESFSGDTNTYWASHGKPSGVASVRMAAYRALLFGSRSLSWLAHRVNPRLGSRVKAR